MNTQTADYKQVKEIETSISKSFRGGWKGQTYRTEAGRTYDISTYKGNNGTITNANLATFWGTKSDYASPALVIYGYEIYEDDAHPADSDYYLRVIFANGSPQTPTISGYTKIKEIQPYCGVSDSGNDFQSPNNTPLNDLYTYFAALNFLKYPARYDYAKLQAIDLTGIPADKFTITKGDDCVTNMISNEL